MCKKFLGPATFGTQPAHVAGNNVTQRTFGCRLHARVYCALPVLTLPVLTYIQPEMLALNLLVHDLYTAQTQENMMEQKSPKKNKELTLKDCIGAVILLPFVLFGAGIFIPDVAEFNMELIAPILDGFEEKIHQRAEKNIVKVKNAPSDQIVRIDIADFSQKWASMTDVQRDEQSTQYSGKIIQLSHQVYDVTRVRNFEENGLGEYAISFGENSILASTHFLTCNFFVMDAAADANLASLNSGSILKFRGIFDKIGYSGIEMNNCTSLR